MTLHEGADLKKKTKKQLFRPSRAITLIHCLHKWGKLNLAHSTKYEQQEGSCRKQHDEGLTSSDGADGGLMLLFLLSRGSELVKVELKACFFKHQEEKQFIKQKTKSNKEKTRMLFFSVSHSVPAFQLCWLWDYCVEQLEDLATTIGSSSISN